MQILLLPLLFFHHRQEVGLLFFSSSLAFFILGYRLFVKLKIVWVNRFLLFILLFVIFFIPHLTPLKHVIPFLDSALIDDYNSFLYSIGDLIVIGKVSDSRILDTLSFYGFIPFIIFIVYTFLSLFSLRFVKKYRIVYFSAFPGIVPFWILFIPLNLLIWCKAITAQEVFWRLCYSSQFWISVACLFQVIELNYIRLFRSKKISHE